MNDEQSEPPDEELIRRIREKDLDPASATAAFVLFYDRHVQFIYRCARKADRQLVGYGIGADDIVEETFACVWFQGADSFDQPPGLSPETAILRTRQWLATIAGNLVKDKVKSRRPIQPLDPGGENEALFADRLASDEVTVHLRLVQLVAELLSERDNAIVWFKIGYYDPETRQSQPPPDELDAFCQEWEITPAALRQAYGRALGTVAQALAQLPITQD